MTHHLSAKNLGAKVVLIRTLTVNYLAEKALLYDVHCHHFKSAVAAVFKEHKGSFGSDLSFYELVAFFEIVSASDLKTRGDSRLHRFASDLDVCFP